MTLARRSLLQRPARSLFSILGIAVGIATVVGVYTLDTNTIQGLQKRYTGGDWRPEMEVSPAPGVQDPQAKLNAISEIAGSAAFFQNVIELRQLDNAEPGAAAKNVVRAHLLAVDADVLPQMDAYRLLAGTNLAGPESASLLLGAKLAKRLGLEPGDQLDLSRPRSSAPKVCVKGKLQREGEGAEAVPPRLTFVVAGILAPEKLGRRAGGEVVIVEFGWGLRLFEGARTNERYWVRPGDAVNIEALQAKLSDSFAYDIGRSVVVGQAADERAYRNGVYMAGLLALMLGLYVIFHTLSMSLVERVREVGVLHALGAGRRQVARIFLFEAFLLSGLGGLLGLAGGVALARGLLSIGVTTLGTGKFIEGFSVPLGVLPLAAIGVGAALLGSIFPLLRLRSASTVEALRGEKAMHGHHGTNTFHIFSTVLIAIILPALYFSVVPVVGEASGALIGSLLLAVGVLGLLLAVPLLIPGVIAGLCRMLARPLSRLFPFAGSMAAHTMAANPRRIAVSSAAIALVCAAFVGLKGMTASLRGEVDEWSVEAVQNKLWVRDLPQLDFRRFSGFLHKLPEVVGIEAGSARTYAPFLLLGLHSGEIESYGPLARHPAQRRAFDKQRGMYISKRVANNLGYAAGDKVPVRIGSGEVVTFTVLEVSDEYGYFPQPDERMYGVISERYLAQDFCVKTSAPDLLGIRLKPGSDPLAVQAVIRQALRGRGEPKFLTGAQLTAIQVDDIRTDFMLFDLILGMTALLAALGVLNGQLLSALERSKELGILRALGASRSQISAMVWLEAGVMGLFGGLLGLLLGGVLTPIILRALETLSGLDLPGHGAGIWNVITLVAAVSLTLAAGAYPVWRMNHTDCVRAIRTG